VVFSGLFSVLAATVPTILRADKPKPGVDAGSLGTQITESDRKYWAFQPVHRPQIPSVGDRAWVRNPIDAFVMARLEKRGWRPAPPAKPRALLRRMFLDLLGLPPTLREQKNVERQPTADRFDAVVRQLLSRPGYGERWGRHWLDLVRYAETNGYERDATKPSVWRYRDYVIRAFNNDKPYNRFLLEQLAGDELSDADTESVIATGYYRLGPWDDEPADFKQDRFDQLDDILTTTSQTFLGLTLGCARCHDHKFDPLTQTDYYRMIAIFNTLSRPQQGRTELNRPSGSKKQITALAVRDAHIHEEQGRINAALSRVRDHLLNGGRTSLPDDAVAAFRVLPNKRTATQKRLMQKYRHQLDAEIAAVLDHETKTMIQAARRRIDQLRRATPDLPRGYFFEERTPRPPSTHLLIRGRASNPGPEVSPGVPVVLARTQPRFLKPTRYTSRRRLTLARWIADKQNPLTARVIVNRVWQHHFGQGLVRTPSDFGSMGETPTHPRLLDWLADWFVNEGGWSLKKLHRLMMASNTYRMSRRFHPEYVRQDPENELLWRLPYHRLEVEAIRDAILAVSGRLNRKMYGPAIYPYVPPAAMAGHSDPTKIWPKFNEGEASRRTVYAFVKRSLVVPFLSVLDLCDTTKSTSQRNTTSVAPQALTLLNGDFVNRQARHFASRLVREVGESPSEQIGRAYRLALCRAPTAAERAALTTFLAHESASLVEESRKKGLPIRRDAAKRKALEQLCRVIFNLNEFVYPD